MNHRQAEYYVGLVIKGFTDALYGMVSIATLHQSLAAGNRMMTRRGMAKLLLASSTATFALISASSGTSACVEFCNRLRAKRISQKQHQYALERATTLRIADKKGLDALLDHTARKESEEWGTIIRSHAEGKTAIISSILNYRVAEREGAMRRLSQYAMQPDMKRIAELGYNGFHHYHPPIAVLGAATNYAIHPGDRPKSPDSICLLTFNMDGRPEAIGYNSSSTFIPANKEKTVLQRATHEDILRYLG